MSSERCIPSPVFDLHHYEILNARGVSNILVGLTLFSIFLGVFYFTYAAKVEGEIVKIQVQNLVDDFMGNIQDTDFDKKDLKAILDKMKVPDMSEEDKKVEESNKKLMVSASKAFGLFAIFSTIVVTYLYIRYRFDIKEIIITNLILLVFIAVTEVIFLNKVAKVYRSLDPHKVKSIIVEEIQSFEKL